MSAFVSDSAQFFLGADTLRQSFHTIFQDPHASMGDKWKAAGVGLLTSGMDGVTIGSTLVGDSEIGEAAQATEEALPMKPAPPVTSARTRALLRFLLLSPLLTPQG